MVVSVTQGHQEIAPNNRAPTSSYYIFNFIHHIYGSNWKGTSTTSNYVPILHRFVRYSQILVENRRFNLPHLHLAPPLGMTPLEFRQDLCHQKTKRIALSYGIKISPVGSLD